MNDTMNRLRREHCPGLAPCIAITHPGFACNCGAAEHNAILDAERETIAALRRELADARAEINDILPELDAVRSMGTQLERELAARTEELEKVRMALATAAETLEAIGEPVVGGEPRATLAICEHIARQRLAAIHPFLSAK